MTPAHHAAPFVAARTLSGVKGTDRSRAPIASKTAFEIAFLIYIPFVIIDLVVASVLMSMGMMMLSPMLVSAPFKILLFVLVDGWVLVVGSLAASFNPI